MKFINYIKGIKLKNNLSVRNMKSTDGITLIALVITIIVLLILAGIAISMLSGENGILRKAAEAKEVTENESTVEQIKLAAIAAMTNKDSKVYEDDLNEELTKYFGPKDEGYTITGNEVSGWKVTAKGVTYLIKSNGTVNKAPDFEELIKRIKQEYEAKKSDLTGISTLKVTSPYGIEGIYENKVRLSDQELKKLITSYEPTLVRLILVKGNLLCIYDQNIMDEEKIKICQENGIYLLGDVDGDNKLTYWDEGYIIKRVQGTVKLDDRQNIVADINCDGGVNGADAVALESTIFLDEVMSPILTMKSEFNNYIRNLEEGVSKTSINASTVEEIQTYIPSYTGNEGLYQFKIQRGVLYWVYNKEISQDIAPQFITESTIEILGDCDIDGKIDQNDIDILSEGLNTGESLNEYGRLDVNGDSIIDNEDLELLKSFV